MHEGGVPKKPWPQPAQPEESDESDRGGGHEIGVQSAEDLGAFVLGCNPGPHLNALHEEREDAPGTSVLPLAGQGRQLERDVLPAVTEKVLRGQGTQGVPSVVWYVPAAHGVQLVFRAVPVPSVVKPRGQNVQEEAPEEVAKLP